MAFVRTSALDADKGSLSLWMSPLEDINLAHGTGLHDQFPVISDRFPSSDVDSCKFAIYYDGSGYPRMVARFTNGNFWGKMDYGVAPVVYAESLPLRKGQWYHISVTWDKKAGILKMYVNGRMVGHNLLAADFMKAGGKLYLGNPLMALKDLRIYDSVQDTEETNREYLADRPVTNNLSDSIIASIVSPVDLPGKYLSPDPSWVKTYECPFTNESDLKGWIFQTGDKYRDKFRLEISENSLLWQTPEEIDTESRGYLWCPVKAEGDQWIEFEYQILSPKGLALVIMCASGSQGEDIVEDHGLLNTGSMGDMLANYRNYHWEFFRKVEAMRIDVETQYLNKNPWGRNLYVGCIPLPGQNRWIKLRFIKSGSELFGSVDGRTVFDVKDDANENDGPVLNSGRIVLRQMYKTSIRYRNFVIYSRTAKQ
jgi:hypothetical protein